MGYTTDLYGEFKIHPALSKEHVRELQAEEKNFSKDEQPPDSYCQWVVNDAGTRLEWDGNEKFYLYVEWLDYLIHFFFQPRGYKLNGEVEWYGEDHLDLGKIVVVNNLIRVRRGRIVYE